MNDAIAKAIDKLEVMVALETKAMLSWAFDAVERKLALTSRTSYEHAIAILKDAAEDKQNGKES